MHSYAGLISEGPPLISHELDAAKGANTMVAVVLPIGHALGGFYASPDAEEPESYEVRVGETTYTLSLDRYIVWTAAHGDYSNQVGNGAKEPQSRGSVEESARELGVGQPAEPYNQLLTGGLLLSLVPTGSSLRKFAEEYQVLPLGIGLGNSSEHPEMIQIGMPGQPRALLGYEAFRVWAALAGCPLVMESLPNSGKANRVRQIEHGL